MLRREEIFREGASVRGYDLWQADIVEMRPYSGFNRSHHYILTVIDVLSKYAWAIPLKSKRGSEMADVIVEIIRASGRKIYKRKFTNGYGKGILQRRCAENLEKTRR